MNKNSEVGSVSCSDLIDAKLEEHQLCGSKHCPGCGHKLQAKPDWVGLPAGVKFDPTDQELIEHLEAKVEAKESKSHPLIDEFIPTIEGEDGICYTHPEKLPGVTRDGLSRHFFHRPSKAYTTGTRKRRKIQTECDVASSSGETRWHKTGKTRPVMANGKQKGCKKILVLYTNFGKNRKPEKTNWVMHQYHLGQYEEEKEGELVVSKIFYQTQPRQCNWSEKKDMTTTTTSLKQNSSDLSAVVNLATSLPMTSYNAQHHMQQLNQEHFNFLPFRKVFDEGDDTSRPREQGRGGTCDEHDHDAIATTYHMSRPSTIISAPSPLPLHHHTSSSSINILDHDPSFHIPSIILPTGSNNFENKHGGRSASGLEELIMGCTSTDIKQANQQEAEWMKYSSFWSDPDNPDHHHR